jgi:two-component system, OmpR family, response regulator
MNSMKHMPKFLPTFLPKIIIVEDDRVIAQLVEKALKQSGFSPVIASDGRMLDRVLKEHVPDLVLLDLMLPGEDGLSIARRLNAGRRVPIIMLTAMGEETDRIIGLELGADDYVVKPFSTRELIARIRAVLRRVEGQSEQSVEARIYRFGGFVFDPMLRVLVNSEGAQIELTGAEMQLLQVFCDHPRMVLSRERLLQLVHARPTGADVRSIDTLVSRLRGKLEADSRNPVLFQTVRLGGYLFTAKVDVQ